MTLVDEDVLAGALQEAALGIDTPDGGPERILDAARAVSDSARPFPTRLVPQTRRARISFAAAAVVLIAVAISLSIVPLGSKGPTRGASFGAFVPGAPTSFGASQGSLSRVNGTGAGINAKGLTTTSKSAQQSSGSALASKVVATGTVALTVGMGKLESAVNELTAIAAHDDGFVASSQVHVGTGSSSVSSGSVVLRVPVAHFAALVAEVQKVGTVTSVKTTSTDVTGEYVDLQARIAALGASRQQYLTIMAKATSINDILAIQAQINVIQSEIEQLEGQRNVLDNEAAYSTLAVSVLPAGEQPGGHPAARSGVTTAWDDSVRGFVLGFEWLIRIAGPALFVLLCLVALFFLGRVVWRASRRRMI
jgi:hypothetical protein